MCSAELLGFPRLDARATRVDRREASALLLPIGAGGRAQGLRDLLQQRALPRVAGQRDARRLLLREAVCGAE